VLFGQKYSLEAIGLFIPLETQLEKLALAMQNDLAKRDSIFAVRHLMNFNSIFHK
jgi:hypothetical protein